MGGFGAKTTRVLWERERERETDRSIEHLLHTEHVLAASNHKGEFHFCLLEKITINQVALRKSSFLPLVHLLFVACDHFIFLDTIQSK